MRQYQKISFFIIVICTKSQNDLAYSLVFLAGMSAELIVRELRIKPHVMLLWWKIHSIVQSTNPKAVTAFSYDRNELMCVSAIFGDDIT